MSDAIRKLLELIEHYRLTRDHQEFAAIEYMAKSGQMSEAYAQYVLEQLEPIIEERNRFPRHLLEVPTADELAVDGPLDVELGSVEGQPETRFGLRISGTPRGILVIGSKGGGKTTVIRNIIHGANRHGIPTLVKDRKCQEYSHLREELGPHWHHYSTNMGAWLGLNAPTGVPAPTWIFLVSSLFAAAGGLIAGASVLARVITFLLATIAQWPDFSLILEVLRAAPYLFSPKPEYAQSLITVLQAVVDASGDLFRTFKGLDVETDLVQQRQSAVFDIGSLQPFFLRTFVVWLLSAQVLQSRKCRGVRTDRIQLLLVDDEADDDLHYELEARLPSRSSPMIDGFREGREAGVEQAACVHSLKTVSDQAPENALDHFFFTVSSADGVVEAAKTLLLPRGGERLFAGLKPGMCLVRQAQSSFPAPFLGRIDYLPPNRSTEAPQFEVPTCLPARSLAELPAVRAALDEGVKQYRASKRLKKRQKQKHVLSDNARKFLDVATVLPPGAPANVLFERMGTIAAATQITIRKELTNAGFVTFKKWRTGKVTRVLVDLQPEGSAFLNKKHNALPGGGSIEHRTSIQAIHLTGQKRTLKTAVEREIPGSTHRADVVWMHPEGHWTAFECVATTWDNLPSHIEACLNPSSPVSKVVIVAATARDCAKYRQFVQEQAAIVSLLDRVQFEVIEPYLLEAFS